MGTLWFVLFLCLVGLVAGAVARLLIPGKQPIGFAMTIVLGILGSLLGGFMSWLISGEGEPVAFNYNLLWAVLGSTVLLGLYVAFTRPRISA